MADVENTPPADTPKLTKSQKKRAAKKRANARKNPIPDREQTEPAQYPLRQLKRYADPADATKFKFSTGVITPWEEWDNDYFSAWKNSSGNTDDLDRLKRDADEDEKWNSYRQAAEVHRTTRQWIHSWLQPGMKMFDIVEKIDAHNRILIGEKRTEANVIEAGLAFPVGVSLNSCAAHYTPNAGDNTVLKYEDVMKIDFGVHINGRIVDSAFTKTFDPKWDALKEASADATNAGIKAAGIDMKLSELGKIIQETMESHEIELNGKSIPIKSITNLTGHSIEQYKIHGGKHVPNCRPSEADGEYKDRMEEGEVFAIETFASTGQGLIDEDTGCSHYMIEFDTADCVPRGVTTKSKLFAEHLYNTFHTLPFCRRWIDRTMEPGQSYLKELFELVRVGWIQAYPGLSDIPGSFTSQMEHTVMIRPTCKEVVSRGSDY